jgi:hypothetical protein
MYKNCGTCSQSLGVYSISDTKVKMIPGYLVLFRNDGIGFHLKKSCKPKNCSQNLDLIYNLYGKSHYEKNITQNREINIDGCPICFNSMKDNNEELYLMEQPCLHTVCTNCIIHLKNKCPICKQNVIENMNNITKLERTLTSCIEKTDTDKTTNRTFTCDPYIMGRTSSCNSVHKTVSETIDYSVNVTSLTIFEQNRINFYENTEPHLALTSNQLVGNTFNSISPLLINVCTDKTITYNDVIVTVFDIDGIDKGNVSYINLRYNDPTLNLQLVHSGDLVKHDIEDGCPLLYHNILLTCSEDYYFKITPFDLPCLNSLNVSSQQGNLPQKEQFNLVYTHSKECISQENLVNTFICSQLTFKHDKTIRVLCPNKTASTAILTTKITENSTKIKEINISEWINDDCNMTTWSIIGLYKY